MTEDRSSPRALGLSVPGAILLGAVIVGAFTSAAVYLVLRPAPAGLPPVTAPSVVGPSVVTTTADTPATVNVHPTAAATETAALPTTGAPPAAATAPTAPASKTAVGQRVVAQLEAARAQLVKDCWSPSVAAKPSPAQAKYVINVTFGADGAQIMRGLTSDRGNERPDVDACLSQELLMLQIAPTGQTVYLEVPFTLP